MPKSSRFTIGEKIDALLLEIIEATYTAKYTSRERKIPYLQKASSKLDIAKLFLQIAWEAEAIENNRYIPISQELDEIGRMLGAWLQKTISQPVAPSNSGK